MRKPPESVSYCILEQNLCRKFESDFPNLSRRINALSERIACYSEKGDVIGFPSDRWAGPRIAVVTFDRTAANAYEKMCMQHFSKRYTMQTTVPKPQFCVELLIQIHGNMEERKFDFRRYGEEYLREFCKDVCQLTN